MTLRLILLLTVLLSNVSLADEGRLETIKIVLADECNLKVTNEEALRYLRSLYLTCVPNSEVVLEESNCTVRCLKPAPGMIIGR